MKEMMMTIKGDDDDHEDGNKDHDNDNNYHRSIVCITNGA